MASERKVTLADFLPYIHAAAHSAVGDAVKSAQDEQYVKRDAEFAAWYSGLDLLQKDFRTTALRIAFNAGWSARKKAEYEMALGLDKPKAE